MSPTTLVYGRRLERRSIGSGAKSCRRLSRVEGPHNAESADGLGADAIGGRLRGNGDAHEAQSCSDQSHAGFDAWR